MLRSMRSMTLAAAPAATVAAAWLAPGVDPWHLIREGLQFLLIGAFLAFVALAVLHPALRRAAFPLVMAAAFAALLVLLPQLREVLWGLAEDQALCRDQAGRSACGAPWDALFALAVLGLALWLLSRLLLRVPGSDQPGRRRLLTDRLGLRLGLVFPWIAGAAPLVAAVLVLASYDAGSSVAKGADAARWLAAWAAVGACAVAAAAIVGDRWLHGRPNPAAPWNHLLPDVGRYAAVRWSLLAVAALVWVLLFAIGAVTVGWGGLLPLAALYAGLLALISAVWAWWRAGRSLGGWLLAAAWILGLGLGLLPEPEAWPARAVAGVALLSFALSLALLARERRWRDSPHLPWLLASGLTLVWGLLSILAADLAQPSLDPTRVHAYSPVEPRSMVVAALGWAGLAAAGSLLSYWVVTDRRVRGGVVAALLLLWAALLAGTGLNDNHPVWTLEGDGVEAFTARQGLEQHLHGWLAAAEKRGLGASPETAAPLVVVAAHGGGLRAAQWTALALDKIERVQPRFRESVFALAAVSGGSLGTLLWRADRPETDPELRSRVLQDSLNHDFLAAVIAGIVIVDLPQRFVPQLQFAPKAQLPDRQRLLEAAWSRAAGKVLAHPDAPPSFLKVAPPSVPGGPALFLVATDTGTGRRWIASNVCVDANIFKEAVDTLTEKRRRAKHPSESSELGPECPSPALEPDKKAAAEDAEKRRLRLPAVTAAGLSARFPWVSPSGRMPSGPTLLDGGMFEATGAETAAEILQVVGNWCRTAAPAPKLQASPPGVLRCKLWSNGSVGARRPDIPDVRRAGVVYIRPLSLQLVNEPMEGPPDDKKPGLRLALPELLGPVLALNASRSGRGFAAWGNLKDSSYYNGAQHESAVQVDIAPNGTKTRVPLTWTLSEGSQAVMRDRLDCLLGKTPGDPCSKEAADLRRWVARLAPPVGSPIPAPATTSAAAALPPG